MDEKFITKQLIGKIKEYANGRANDVKRGAETPRFAALLLQKYGYGIADAAFVLCDNEIKVDRGAIFKVVDEEVEKIDPNWQENGRERWEGRPADILINKE